MKTIDLVERIEGEGETSLYRKTIRSKMLQIVSSFRGFEIYFYGKVTSWCTWFILQEFVGICGQASLKATVGNFRKCIWKYRVKARNFTKSQTLRQIGLNIEIIDSPYKMVLYVYNVSRHYKLDSNDLGTFTPLQRCKMDGSSKSAK